MPIGIAIKAGQLAAPHVANATVQIGHAVAPHRTGPQRTRTARARPQCPG
jgi:hypothetical protein